jgi:hypothetical protein
MEKIQPKKIYFSLVGLWILILLVGCVGIYNETPAWLPVVTYTPIMITKPTPTGTIHWPIIRNNPLNNTSLY